MRPVFPGIRLSAAKLSAALATVDIADAGGRAALMAEHG